MYISSVYTCLHLSIPLCVCTAHMCLCVYVHMCMSVCLCVYCAYVFVCVYTHMCAPWCVCTSTVSVHLHLSLLLHIPVCQQNYSTLPQLFMGKQSFLCVNITLCYSLWPTKGKMCDQLLLCMMQHIMYVM